MDATSLATVWATIALAIFIAICIYIKVPGMVAKSLDQRADRIRSELDEARRLNEEAQALLAEYQKKRKAAEQEAAEIVAAAKNEAGLLLKDAKAKTEDYVARRTAAAETKIAQAERDAINEVRAKAVDVAVAAAQQVIAGKMEGKLSADLFDASLKAVKARLN